MTGVRVRLALWDASQSLKGMFSIWREGYLHPGKGRKYILSTRPMSTPPNASCATYPGEKSEDLIRNLTENQKYKVSCRVSQNRAQDARNARMSAHTSSPGCEKNDRECKEICDTTTVRAKGNVRCVRISREKLRPRVRTESSRYSNKKALPKWPRLEETNLERVQIYIRHLLCWRRI